MNQTETTSLVKRAEDILSLAADIQDEALGLSEAARRQRLEEVRELYMAWYRECLRQMQGDPLVGKFLMGRFRDNFKKEYEGNWATMRIKHFLKYGWKVYAGYNPERPKVLIPKWTSTYSRAFREPLERQMVILLDAGVE